MLKVKKAQAVSREDAEAYGQARPGEIVAAHRDLLYVQTGDGLLSLLQVQPEGKKQMDTGAFLRGYRLAAGDAFDSSRE
jgi:methionyl-tRNA formyltransferase